MSATRLSTGPLLRFDPDPADTLPLNLTSSFLWTETSGTRSSGVGGYTVTEVNGSVPKGTAPDGLNATAGCLDFTSGTAGYLRGAAGIPAPSATVSVTRDFTLAVWLYDPGSSWKGACGYGTVSDAVHWDLFLHSNEGVRWQVDVPWAVIGSRPTATSTSRPLDGWTCVFGEYRATYALNSRNACRRREGLGTNAGTGNALATVAPASPNLFVGRCVDTNFNPWLGKIGPLFTWSRLLTPAERGLVANGWVPGVAS